MAMAPSLRSRRRRIRGFLPPRSFFFRALALRRRPFSPWRLPRQRQPQAAPAALGIEHSMELLPGPKTKRARTSTITIAGGDDRSSAPASAAAAAAIPDLLSDLPDCLLHTIISLLKARQAVQTCVLSKRWTQLWRTVPCLNVDVAEFKMRTNTSSPPPPPAPGSCSRSWPDEDDFFKTSTALPPCSCDGGDKQAMNWEELGKFADFAVNLAQRYSIPALDTLRLHGHGESTPLLFLRYAAAGSSSSGEMERLTMSSSSAAAATTQWRRLRRLRLTCVLLDHCFAMYVGSGCLSLQDLELDGCTFEIPAIFFGGSLKTMGMKHCRLSRLSEISASPMLKTLAILGALMNEPYSPLVISAPGVAHLHLSVTVEWCEGGLSIKEMPSLDKAMIELFCRRYYVPNTQLSGGTYLM